MTVFPITLTMRREGGAGVFVVEPELFPFETTNSGVDQMGALAFLSAINNAEFKNYLLATIDCDHCPVAISLEQNPVWSMGVGVRKGIREVGLFLSCNLHPKLEKWRKEGDPGVVATNMTTPCEETPHTIEVRTLGDAK